ncbi:10926_t:CDS:1, partial [Acaulospora morrowiae]
WFEANSEPAISNQARKYTYVQFPQNFVFNKCSKKWKLRICGNVIGHMYFVYPGVGECYYLRMLLNVVHGAQSFEHLRTINDIEHVTFKNVCQAMGLLQDDLELDQCLKEVSIIQTGQQLRHLFVTILINCHPTEPENL